PTQARLTWTDNSAFEYWYDVWISTNGSAFHLVASWLPADSQEFVLDGLTTEQPYWVWVVAQPGIGTADAQFTLPDALPGFAPQQLEATASAGDPSSVTLSWLDQTAGESGWRIERSDDGGAFATIATLPADSQ